MLTDYCNSIISNNYPAINFKRNKHFDLVSASDWFDSKRQLID